MARLAQQDLERQSWNKVIANILPNKRADDLRSFFDSFFDLPETQDCLILTENLLEKLGEILRPKHVQERDVPPGGLRLFIRGMTTVLLCVSLHYYYRAEGVLKTELTGVASQEKE
jgi:hypothetical protein